MGMGAGTLEVQVTHKRNVTKELNARPPKNRIRNWNWIPSPTKRKRPRHRHISLARFAPGKYRTGVWAGRSCVGRGGNYGGAWARTGEVHGYPPRPQTPHFKTSHFFALFSPDRRFLRW